MQQKITISTTTELVRIAPKDIIYIEAQRQYSKMVTSHELDHIFSFNLSRFADLFNHYSLEELAGTEFIRIGKKYIVNKDYIFSIAPTKQQMQLINPNTNTLFELKVSKDALKLLKDMIEASEAKDLRGGETDAVEDAEEDLA